MDPFVGEIRVFANTFAPRGWALCDGSTLSIQQNTVLFSILGITYGGNGTTTFKLPDLGGRVPVGVGQGPGLTNWVSGQTDGSSSVTLLSTQVPNHTHQLGASAAPANASAPENGQSVFARSVGGQVYSAAGSPPLVALAGTTVGNTGNGGSHNNMQPYLALNYCIALQGIYPSRP